jgi:hypothetical protein
MRYAEETEDPLLISAATWSLGQAMYAAHLRRRLAHLQGLIDFAIVQSYLDTATKWGIDKLHALQQLFTTGPWLPPALTPAE